MWQWNSKAWQFLCSVAVVLAIGCGGNSGRQAVRGTVTIDGQPLQIGTINFVPVEGSSATGAGGAVIQGRFDIAAKNGPQVGSHRVRILAQRKTGQTVKDPQFGQVEQTEMVHFRESDTLTAEIKPGGGNTFEFSLSKMP